MTSKSSLHPVRKAVASNSATELDVKPLFTSDDIGKRIDALAEAIAARGTIAGPLVLIGVLRGAVPFVADLARALHSRRVPLVIDYILAESYKGTSTTGEIALGTPPSSMISGRDVLIVDDILDTGLTLAAVLDSFERASLARIASCVLLDKTTRRLNGLQADFVGFECPDLFVVGYGMDLDGRFRELPFIGTVGA